MRRLASIFVLSLLLGHFSAQSSLSDSELSQEFAAIMVLVGFYTGSPINAHGSVRSRALRQYDDRKHPPCASASLIAFTYTSSRDRQSRTCAMAHADLAPEAEYAA